MKKENLKRIGQTLLNMPKEDEIYFAVAGWNMRYASYIKIKKVMNKMVEIVEIGKTIVNNNDSFQPIVTADPEVEKGSRKRSKIFKNSSSDIMILYKGNYYSKWNGTTFQEDLLD